MEDETIEVNGTSYSLRKILEEDGWKTYCKASEKVKSIARLKVRMDLSDMEIGFVKLDKMFKEQKEVNYGKTKNHNRRYD
jgi:hypothetical protein